MDYRLILSLSFTHTHTPHPTHAHTHQRKHESIHTKAHTHTKNARTQLQRTRGTHNRPDNTKCSNSNHKLTKLTKFTNPANPRAFLSSLPVPSESYSSSCRQCGWSFPFFSSSFWALCVHNFLTQLRCRGIFPIFRWVSCGGGCETVLCDAQAAAAQQYARACRGRLTESESLFTRSLAHSEFVAT